MTTRTTRTKGQQSDRGATSRRSAGERALDTEAAERARRIVRTEVSFIHSADFEQPDAELSILADPDIDNALTGRRRKAPSDVPPHLKHLWQVELLGPEEERQLFRRMNFQKFRANALRSRLNPSRPDVRLMDEAEESLTDACRVRDHIIQANLRLVVSIARKFVDSVTTLDELTSDGNLILMKAVNRFDYSQGFRFSTYATHAIQREFFRSYTKRRRRKLREVTADPEVLLESVEAPEDPDRRLNEARAVEYLKQIMTTCLDAREYEIVNRRLGLNADDGGQTLREVGESLRISKERVRQIQVRAMEKLRLAANIDTDES